MDMEAGTEEFVGSSNNDATVSHLVKGKRTKRQRPISPCATITCSSSSASGADYGSTTTYESTDQEEEDMANCLILLAQGQNNQPEFPATSKTERATATTAKIGFYTYECKTCNRTFPSFQALGGHRASHKKPKLTLDEKKPPTPPQLFEEAGQVYIKSTPQVSLGLAANGLVHSNKAKIHECSICGSEFTSGQALGGHMRRHRASATTSPQAIETSSNAVSTVRVKPRNILPLELDLNLPAPEEDLRDSKFQFTPTQKPLVLSAPSLVDCHY